MARQNTAVFGIYRDREGVERAGDILRRAGFRNTGISELFPENEGTKDFAVEKGTEAPECTLAGAGTGAAFVGALGWLVGVGALSVPGLDPVLSAGPIVGALAGMGAGGVVGGLIGALVGFGMPEYEAKRHERQIRRGGILMAVQCDNPDRVKRAKDILKETGAEDIAPAGKASDFAKSDKPMPRRATHQVDEVKPETSQPRVIEEKLDDTVELDDPLTKRSLGSS